MAHNPTKSDAILFGTSQRLKTMSSLSSVKLDDSVIQLSHTVKILGATLDSNWSVTSLVSFTVWPGRANDDNLMPASTEDVDESLKKLTTHRAEENEVDAAVDESQDVEQVSEVEVDSGGELTIQAPEKHDDALRHLCNEEQNDDCKQHSCRAVGCSLSLQSLK